MVDCVSTGNGDGLPPAEPVPFTKTLTFPEGGGTQTIFMGEPGLCTITETPPAGCTLVSINPPTVDAIDTIEYPVTVTNDCVAAAAAVTAAHLHWLMGSSLV